MLDSDINEISISMRAKLCDDRRVAKKQAFLYFGGSDTVYLSSTHETPCYYIKKSSNMQIEVLKKGCSVQLFHGDKFSLVRDSFWYELLYVVALEELVALEDLLALGNTLPMNQTIKKESDNNELDYTAVHQAVTRECGDTLANTDIHQARTQQCVSPSINIVKAEVDSPNTNFVQSPFQVQIKEESPSSGSPSTIKRHIGLPSIIQRDPSTIQRRIGLPSIIQRDYSDRRDSASSIPPPSDVIAPYQSQSPTKRSHCPDSREGVKKIKMEEPLDIKQESDEEPSGRQTPDSNQEVKTKQGLAPQSGPSGDQGIDFPMDIHQARTQQCVSPSLNIVKAEVDSPKTNFVQSPSSGSPSTIQRHIGLPSIIQRDYSDRRDSASSIPPPSDVIAPYQSQSPTKRSHCPDSREGVKKIKMEEPLDIKQESDEEPSGRQTPDSNQEVKTIKIEPQDSKHWPDPQPGPSGNQGNASDYADPGMPPLPVQATPQPDTNNGNQLPVQAMPQSNNGNQLPVQATPPNRERCWYGASCYRQNPAHKAQFAHPSDSDWGPGVKSACPYGRYCVRRDPRHWRDHTHPPRTGRARADVQIIRINLYDGSDRIDSDSDDSE